MKGLLEEFGFIPPELLYKCDALVRAFQTRPGKGKDFVAASVGFSAGSPYLRGSEIKIGAIAKMIKALMAAAVIAIAAIAFVSVWALLALVPLVGTMWYLYRLTEGLMTQHRSIILAVEMLAIDFGGWGTLFPRARDAALLMSLRDAGASRLIDLYLPREKREDPSLVELFTPSAGSIASARAAA